MLLREDWVCCFLNLRTLDTFGNCQRSVFLIGIYPNIHKITNLSGNLETSEKFLKCQVTSILPLISFPLTKRLRFDLQNSKT